MDSIKLMDYYEVCENYSNDKKIIFESNPYDFRVVMPNLNYNVGRGVGRDVGRDVGIKRIMKKERIESIINLIKENSEITINDLSLKFDVSKKTIEKDIKEIQERNKIKRIGNNPKHGVWEIVE